MYMEQGYSLVWNVGRAAGLYPGGMPLVMKGKFSGVSTRTRPSAVSLYGVPSGSTGVPGRCSVAA